MVGTASAYGDEDRELARELSRLMPFARDAWPACTDEWRLSLMQIAVQTFAFRQPGPDATTQALIALETALMSLARSHRERAARG